MGSAISPTDYANATETMVNGVLVTRTSQRIAIGDVDDTMELAFCVQPRYGYYDVICHGYSDGGSLAPYVGSTLGDMSAEQLAVAILAQPDYDRQPIRLLACWMGLIKDGFAAELDHLLGGVGVLTCTKEIMINDDGTLSLTLASSWLLFLRRGIFQPLDNM
jgi:hypothetical protein